MRILHAFIVVALLFGGTLFAADQPPPNQVEFWVEKKVFFNATADLGTSPALVLVKALGEAQTEGYGPWETDEKSGATYTRRFTKGAFLRKDSGTLEYREYLPRREGTSGVALRELRRFELESTLPAPALAHPITALHPLGWSAPEFESLREELYRGGSRQQIDPNTTVVATTKFLYRIVADPETGQPAELVQRAAADGALLRRTQFSDWKQNPATGRWTPGTVASRTYRGSESQPLVELTFTGITEKEAAKAMFTLDLLGADAEN